MTPRFPDLRPRPELLAAYADGELPAAERARVEAWLRGHPEAAVELSGQCRLSRRNRGLWQAVAPPEPGERAWSVVLNRVEAALATASCRPAPPPAGAATPRRWGRPGAPLVAAAALLALALLPVRPPADPPADEWAGWGVFPVAGADDVEIESLRPDDANLLVVGASPLNALAWATSAEVTLVGVEPDGNDGMVPAAGTAAPGGVPIVYTPLTRRP